MQSNDQRGPGRATMTSTAAMVVVVLMTGLAVGAGATWLALSRDDDGVAASPDGCAEFRSVDLVVAPEMYSVVVAALAVVTDRKSTRLNSSHLVISYAVFCLKLKMQPVH